MQTEPEQIEAAEETELCISCVAPNIPDANFCCKCGAPLSAYAAITPFERLYAEGFIYREATERPRKLVILLGIWVIFGFPVALAAFLIIVGAARAITVPAQMGGGLALLLGPVIVMKATRNYFQQAPHRTEE